MDSKFRLKFWGVRGSVAVSNDQTRRYGGNTPCVEAVIDDERLIFDAGTGLREFGASVDDENPLSLKIFLSHCHLDHIVGLPFFPPAFKPRNSLWLYAGHLKPQHMTLARALDGMMQAPILPIAIDFLKACRSIEDFSAGERLYPLSGRDDVTLDTRALRHPGGATGYRLTHANRVFAYVTDFEHLPGVDDRNVLDLMRDADVVVYDSAFTEHEWSHYQGWGHSTWQEGVRLCKLANAKKMIAFHHKPHRTDDELDQIQKELDVALPGSIVGYDGLEISLI